MKYRWWLLLILLVCTVGGWWLFNQNQSVETLLESAQYLKSEERYAEAELRAQQALAADPTHPQALVLAAECAERFGDYERMFEYIDRIPSEDSSTWVKAHLIKAGLMHYKLARLADAEEVYRQVLEHNPEQSEANMQLAQLLGLVARRYDAIPYILRLIRQGTSTDLVMLLARESGALRDSALIERAITAAPEDPNPWLSRAWEAASELQLTESVNFLKTATQLDPTHGATAAMLGKQLWAAGEFEALQKWQQTLPARALEYPDTWLVQGYLADRDGGTREAIRCFGEAVSRAPESKAAHAQLAKLFSNLKEEELAELFRKRVLQLQSFEDAQNKAIFAQSKASYEDLVDYVKQSLVVGRFWEAYAWGQVAFEINPESPELIPLWPEFLNVLSTTPLTLTAPSHNLARKIKLAEYPLPDRTSPAMDNVIQSVPDTKFEDSSFQFKDEASEVGMVFQYVNGAPLDAQQRRMYEFTGGGIGVLDLDLDGYPDVYLTQGQTVFGTEEVNDSLFRNLSGERFEEITQLANLSDLSFGQGVAIGDLNADGYSDLFVCNIGENSVWLNNGDGTFEDVSMIVAGNEWSTSAAIADLNGDQLPDIYEVNYLQGDDLLTRVCQHREGSPVMCLPFDFPGATDQVWINKGDGRFVNGTETFLSENPNGKGLGVLSWDANGDGQLSVLVTNDTTPNFLFSREESDGLVKLREHGILSGIALNANGKAEGCMGIAAADLHRNGRMDIHITNFLAETNTLYEAGEGGFFADRTDEFGLGQATFSQLGFGTQFIDVDLDGIPELFVANGHVDDLQAFDRAYRMPPQLFRWTGTKFVELPADQLGRFFTQRWLGRAVASFDWNQDGRKDVLVGQLADPTSLLTNLASSSGYALVINLVGDISERSAIGATVQVKIGNQVLTQQLTSGDGYQCSNERQLIFGCGTAKVAEQVTVRWPSGKVGTFDDVTVPNRLILREGRGALTASN